jgi:hypothetical protein
MDWNKFGKKVEAALKATGNGIVTGTVFVAQNSKTAAVAVKDATVAVGKAYKEEWQKQKKGDK